MKPTKYEIFLKVVELGSMTAAANYYNYTQSAVSQIINSLENELGCGLLVRNRSGNILSSEGRRLLPYIQDICESYQALVGQVEYQKENLSGTIHIAGFTSVNTHWLPKLIQKFRELHPNVQFVIGEGTYDEIESWVFDGTTDLGIISQNNIKTLDLIKICDDPILAVLPRRHVFHDADHYPLEHLSKESFIYHSDGEEWLYRSIFQNRNQKPSISYYVKNDFTVMAMVEADMGISLLPLLILAKTNYDLVIKETMPPCYRPIQIAIRDRKRLSPASKTFLSFMISMFRDGDLLLPGQVLAL